MGEQAKTIEYPFGAARPHEALCACLRHEKSPPRNQVLARAKFRCIVLDKHLERLYNNHKGFML